MIFLLLSIRTGFSATDRALNLMVTYAINTGLATSLLAVASLIAWIHPYYPHFVYQSFSASMGGVYTFTLLANLHARTRARTRLLPGSKEDAHQSIHLSRLPIKIRQDISRFPSTPLPLPASQDGDEPQDEDMAMQAIETA